MADATEETTTPLGTKIVFSAWLGIITVGLVTMIALPLMGR